jgi:peptidoglycan/LPS O-acetylase OafA/YrhL
MVTASPAQQSERERPGGNLLRSSTPELDTMAGIAVLLVLFFMASASVPACPGLSGFPRFLVAGWAGTCSSRSSGFLITGFLLDSKLQSNYYRSFSIGRALRIWPLC